LLVKNHEIRRLKDEGHPDPEGTVDHVSARDLGSPYDIRSAIKLEAIWEPLYIEVKISTDPNSESFPMSSGEFAFALDSRIRHRLYHVRGVLSTAPGIRVIDFAAVYRADLVTIHNETLRVRLRAETVH